MHLFKSQWLGPQYTFIAASTKDTFWCSQPFYVQEEKFPCVTWHIWARLLLDDSILSLRHFSASGHRQHVLLPAAADRACSPWLSQPGVDMQVPGAWRALPALHLQQASPRTPSPSLYLPGVCSSMQMVRLTDHCLSLLLLWLWKSVCRVFFNYKGKQKDNYSCCAAVSWDWAFWGGSGRW